MNTRENAGAGLESEIEHAISMLMPDRSPPWVRGARVADAELLLPRDAPVTDVLVAGSEALGVGLGGSRERIPPPIGRIDISLVSAISSLYAERYRSVSRDTVDVQRWKDGSFARHQVVWMGDRWVAREPGSAGRAIASLTGLASLLHVGRAEFWRVVVQADGGFPVSFSTDAHGVSESFKMREAPSPTKRRTALLHWVAEHWRKKRDEPGAVVAVREHLRGATSFVWNDWTCKIRPSRVDIAKLGDLGKKFANGIEPA